MSSATSALYEPLIERDLDAIPAAVRAFHDAHSEEELFLAVARFAVLAYAPSQHAKHAVLCARAAYDVRDVMGAQWVDLLGECARYAAESRQPWSEPPLLEAPQIDPGQPRTVEEIRAAIAGGDRLRAERWLAARLDDPDLEHDLRSLATGDALLMTDAAFALIPILGEKGKYALLRIPVWEMTANPPEPAVETPLDILIARAIEEKGSIESVHAVFWSAAAKPPLSKAAAKLPLQRLPVYHLARDYGQTLIAHALAPRLPGEHVEPFLAAVHHNLEHGESYAEWSFA